ncbi:Mur ligase family protein [Patescibacteria group bacterium]
MLKKLIPKPLLLFYHKLVGLLAAFTYRFPGRKLKIIGVTGTNGKTTTLNLIAKILEEHGKKVGMISTAIMKVGEKSWLNESKMTSLDPFSLNKFLRKLKRKRIPYALLEVSSHALEQSRFLGVPFDVGVFTNLSPEHLDYHKDLDEYREAKEKLFYNVQDSKQKPNTPKALIINGDDESFEYFNRYQADRKYTYEILDKERKEVVKYKRGKKPLNQEQKIKFPTTEGEDLLIAKDIKLEPNKTTFNLETKEFNGKITTHLSGIFNIQNTLAAIAVGLSQNIPLTTIQKALMKIKGVPGRLETIENNKDITIIVDYAHTPDALRNVYATIKPLIKNRLITVLGACGDRDKTKRPKLGSLAALYADFVIIADEDPYTEDPAKIRAEVIDGVVKGNKEENKNFWEIANRKKAIQFALKKARKGDVVMITGKGCEQLMIKGKKKIPWDDRKVVREALKKT